VLAVLSLLGVSLLTIASTESHIASNELEALRALYIAEAGLARAARDILLDLYADPAGAKPAAEQGPAERRRLRYLATAARDGGCPAGATADGDGSRTGRSGQCYYDLGPGALRPGTPFRIPYGEAELDEGSFAVELAHPGDGAGLRRVRAVATGRTRRGAERRVEAVLDAKDLGPWSNAIFTRGRLALPPGTVVAGSLHVLGEGGAGEAALELQGAQVWNHYDPAEENGSGIAFLRVAPGAPARYLAAGLDPGRATLQAEVRVGRGGIAVSDAGGAIGRLGEPADPSSARKGPLDGVYARTGLWALAGQGRVQADTALGGAYVASAHRPFAFPAAAEAEATVPAAVIDGPLDLGGAYRCAEPPGAAPLRLCPDGARWILEVAGLVRVDGDLRIGSEAVRAITVRGRGTIYSGGPAGGRITVRADLLPPDHDPTNPADRCGGAPCFPRTDALGLVARTSLLFAGPGGGPLIVAGAFYAGGRATLAPRTWLAGALVADEVDLQGTESRIYQVPSLARHLPPGLPGSAPIFHLRLIGWRELIP
jgi:hypothetical protein